MFNKQYLNQQVSGYSVVERDPTVIQGWQDEVFKHFLAILFLLGANITKYRLKIEGLHTQKNLKTTNI